MKKLKILIITCIGFTFAYLFLIYSRIITFLFDSDVKYDSVFNIRNMFYLFGFIILLLGFLWVAYCLFATKRQKKQKKETRQILNDATLKQQLDILKELNAPTHEIEQDWQQLKDRQTSDEIVFAVFGEVNTGKSALVHLLTNEEILSSSKAGQTKLITTYQFKVNEQAYQLMDMPGFSELDNNNKTFIYDHTVRSHVVLFVIDEDITQSVFEHYQYLKTYGCPIIIVINKADYYDDQEKIQLESRIRSVLKEQTFIVWTSSITKKQIEKHHEDGRIEILTKEVRPSITHLLDLIREIGSDKAHLNEVLTQNYFKAIENDVDKAFSVARHQKGSEVVKSYSQKAVVAGMATVGPGTDLIVQGYLGIKMVKSLCHIYGIELKSVEVEEILNLLAKRAKKELAMILTLVGNVCKAFPGIGTIAGGMLHAIAYGLIFEAIGKTMMICLEKDVATNQSYLIKVLEEQISENLEARAKRLIKAFLLQR